MKAKQKLGDLLVASGTIDAAQLTAALGEQKSWGRPLGMTLVRMGFVDEDTLIHALASQLKLPIVKLAGKGRQPGSARSRPDRARREVSLSPAVAQ